MTLKATPFVTLAGAVTLKWVAGGALTVMFTLPLIEPSPAVSDCAPVEVNVAENVWAPLSPGTKV